MNTEQQSDLHVVQGISKLIPQRDPTTNSPLHLTLHSWEHYCSYVKHIDSTLE